MKLTMTSTHVQNAIIDKWCKVAIDDHLGDLSDMPDALLVFVRKVYFEFITAYLFLLRQKEKKPHDWFPKTWVIDLELADDMRHFFSDYQHVTKAFFNLNAKMKRLQEIDQKRQPHIFQHAVEEILNLDVGSVGSGE